MSHRDIWFFFHMSHRDIWIFLEDVIKVTASSYYQIPQGTLLTLHSYMFHVFCFTSIKVIIFNTDILTHGTFSLTHPLTHSLTHSLTHLLTHSLTHSLTHWLTHALTHSLTHSTENVHM